MKVRTLLFVFIVAMSLPFVAPAVDEEPAGEAFTLPSLEERQNRLGDFDLAVPEAPAFDQIDTKTKEQYLYALQRYYEYRVGGYVHRENLFEWQFLSSKVIFFVVLVLVFAGIYFAAVQFHIGLKTLGDQKAAGPEETTEIDFSLKGFKIRSPVLGVIILGLSLAFFYLYLVYVYPIENVF